MLDRARSQMIEDLIAGMAFAGNLPNLIEVGRIEVAHPPGEDLALALKLVEPRDRVLKRMPAAPVQEIAIEPVSLEAGKRPLASRHHSTPRGVLGKHLGDQEGRVASPGDRFGDHLLGGA